MSEGYRVQPWQAVEPPSVDVIRRKLEDEGLRPYSWSNAPGDVYPAHSHAYQKVIYVVRGSITFGLPDFSERIELNEGDRLELPANVSHEAVVGPQGVTCMEAHLRW